MAITILNNLISANLTQQGSSDRITGTEVRQVLSTVNGILSTTIPSTTNIPFNSLNTVLAEHVMTSASVITVNSTDSFAGARAIARYVGDGNPSHVLDLTNFKHIQGATNLNINTANNAVTEVFYTFDGTDYVAECKWLAVTVATFTFPTSAVVLASEPNKVYLTAPIGFTGSADITPSLGDFTVTGHTIQAVYQNSGSNGGQIMLLLTSAFVSGESRVVNYAPTVSIATGTDGVFLGAFSNLAIIDNILPQTFPVSYAIRSDDAFGVYIAFNDGFTTNPSSSDFGIANHNIVSSALAGTLIGGAYYLWRVQVAERFNASELVTINYYAYNHVISTNNKLAGTFNNQSVTNNIPQNVSVVSAEIRASDAHSVYVTLPETFAGIGVVGNWTVAGNVVSGLAITGNILQVMSNTAYTAGATITVSYTPSTPYTSVNGHVLSGVTAMSVTNNLRSLIQPTLIEVKVGDPNNVYISYSSSIVTQGSVVADFAVSGHTVSAVSVPTANDAQLVLALTTPIIAGATITASYTPASAIIFTNNQQADIFTAQSVTNRLVAQAQEEALVVSTSANMPASTTGTGTVTNVPAGTRMFQASNAGQWTNGTGVQFTKKIAAGQDGYITFDMIAVGTDSNVWASTLLGFSMYASLRNFSDMTSSCYAVCCGHDANIFTESPYMGHLQGITSAGLTRLKIERAGGNLIISVRLFNQTTYTLLRNFGAVSGDLYPFIEPFYTSAVVFNGTIFNGTT